MMKTREHVQTTVLQHTVQSGWTVLFMHWRHRGRCWRLSVLRLLLVSGSIGGIGVGVLGCSGDNTMSPPAQSDTNVFWALQLNQHAVNLALQAPYNTMQLTATPLTMAGTPLANVGQATFQGSDSSVTVDAKTGLMTAHYVTAQTQVIATLQVQGTTIADTAYVQVTATAPRYAVASLSLQPAPGDSAKRSGDFVYRNHLAWPATVTDVAHDTVCSANGGCPLLIYYTSSDLQLLDNSGGASGSYLSGNFRSGGNIGRAVLFATTWAYGVAKRDSVVFTIGYFLNYAIVIDNIGVDSPYGLGVPEPKKVVLGVGAVVNFHNMSDHKTGITFVDTTGMDTATGITSPGGENVPPNGAGNIAAFGADTINDFGVSCAADLRPGNFNCYISPANYHARRFRIAKSYKFFTTLFPADTFELDVR